MLPVNAEDDCECFVLCVQIRVPCPNALGESRHSEPSGCRSDLYGRPAVLDVFRF